MKWCLIHENWALCINFHFEISLPAIQDSLILCMYRYTIAYSQNIGSGEAVIRVAALPLVSYMTL